MFLDDFYPERSPIRIIEGDLILKHYPGSKHFKTIYDPTLEKEKFDMGHMYHPSKKEKFDFAYTIGLLPSFNRIEIFEKYKMPFCFENYPGFGFALNSPYEKGHWLHRVTTSKMFRGLISTQPCTRRYIEMCGIPPHQHCYIFGGFVNPEFYNKANLKFRKKPKVFFCANSYERKGKIKGFDIFHEAAKYFPDYEFEAFGNWWNYVPLPNLKMHGEVPNQTFHSAYQLGDVFLSCNRSIEGLFDGFPTGAANEAGLAGCCLVISDPVHNNAILNPKTDFVLVDPRDVYMRLGEILGDPHRRIHIALSGREVLRKVYDPEIQFAARKTFFESIIKYG